jgi:hypothetical protein
MKENPCVRHGGAGDFGILLMQVRYYWLLSFISTRLFLAFSAAVLPVLISLSGP